MTVTMLYCVIHSGVYIGMHEGTYFLMNYGEIREGGEGDGYSDKHIYVV